MKILSILFIVGCVAIVCCVEVQIGRLQGRLDAVEIKAGATVELQTETSALICRTVDQHIALVRSVGVAVDHIAFNTKKISYMVRYGDDIVELYRASGANTDARIETIRARY